MPGTFLLTFDSEGKWGWADDMKPGFQCYTSQALDETYRRLLGMLEHYGVAATFAFTAAFALHRRDFEKLQPAIQASPLGATHWMRTALAGIQADAGDGWFAPGCIAAVRDRGLHEIGSHGFSHIPWQAPYATREVLNAELQFVRRVPGFEHGAVRSFVYPRNEVAHPDLLRSHGFTNYRGSRSSLGRLPNYLREFNLFARSEPAGLPDDVPVALPCGHFLNWRVGLRRRVPFAVTVQRWRHMVRHATRTGGVVQAWTHPENFVDGHAMFPLLDSILRMVAEEREAGRLRVVTCSGLAQQPPPPGREVGASVASVTRA